MEYKRLTTKDEEGNWQIWEDDYSHPFEALQCAIDRLAELEDKIEQGTLKEINYPCNVGDKVFVVRYATSDTKNFYIFEDIVSQLCVDKNVVINAVWLYITLREHTSVFEWNFDKVFLTREEAEAKLKELQGDKE